MEHQLPAVGAVVGDDAVAFGLEPEILRDLGHRAPEADDQLGRRLGAEIGLRDVLALGDHQHMHRRLRMDVVEGQRKIVLVDLLARQLAAQDAREDVVAIVGGHRGLRTGSRARVPY